MSAKVHVSVEFVSTKKGKKPSVFIEDPIDLTRAIGKFNIDDFSDPFQLVFMHPSNKSIVKIRPKQKYQLAKQPKT